MSTYKFLAKGARGPISGFEWPASEGGLPGSWVEVEGPLGLCTNGCHVCRPSELAHWLHDELWEVETQGEQLEGLDCLVVRRARLARRVDAWHLGGAAQFGEACAQHAAELSGRAPRDSARAAQPYIEDAFVSVRAGFVAVGAHASALAVCKLGDPAEEYTAYRRERVWQSEWIARAVIGV
jgi:hypothetical protein